MRWLQNISFSQASLSPPSTSSSPTKAAGERIGPKLTRQRNLRYLSEREITGALHLPPPDGEPAATTTPTTTTASPPGAAPQPLPLPEISLLFRRVGGFTGSQPERGDCPLPSPEEAGIVRDRGDGSNEGSVLSQRDKKIVLEPLEARTSTRVFQDVNAAESSYDNFMINVPIRSAPTSPFATSPFAASPFASPMLSPPKVATGDFFPYYYITPKANQIWSAPEMPTGVPLPTYPDYVTFSSESSPLHSPQMKSPPHVSSRSISGPSPMSRRESNSHTSVHPLPLPPGAASLSPSGNPHVAFKPESVPLNSQWQKGKLIGRGTFGSVYVASNLETGALCAMKEVELFPDDPKSIECMKQLEQEIKVLSRLKHPNIVQYYGSEIIEDRFYIYLEYVHPGSINKYVREHCGAITESVVRCFTRHILSGLAYLHSKKTIHRDIKGANLLVDASGVVKLADFGMAKHLSGQASDLSLKGSPYWMAPELMNAVMQRDSNSDVALAVDIWSLGCTIIEMLTGKPPWSEYEGAAAMFKILKDTPPIPESLSPEGKDFLQHCFKRNPAERSSAAMLLEHRFLKNSQLHDNQSCSRQASNRIKLKDLPLSPGQQRSKNAIDHSLVCPTARSVKSNATFDGESGWQSHHRAADVAASSRKSPRSILEAIPSLSPPHSDGSSNDPSTSSNPPSSGNESPTKNHVFR
ncbi:hypothetical protein CDL15_Pgr016393 [Punica granatum]|uniref:mitogen-activated protein kinase kinase kinase n=1 Tax=Punica granatum TaxID=22663 RepID=A0A218XWM7_PUNGR|nr:hypothetical protein CDL15_Pgr016393 [Punica granatum]PKI47783.1 hypothetical protein CRG98_031833 [Punica granatum]